jgi:17 kDa outer membrane surface antigen
MSNSRWFQANVRFWCAVDGTRRRVAAASIAGLLFGCASQFGTSPELPAAQLPTLTAGNSYSFDDGRTERIVEASSGLARWRGADDFTFTTTNNVLLPRTAWHDGQLHGMRTMAVAPAALFPLSLGNSVSFAAQRRVTDSRTGAATELAEAWQCRVDDTERVAIQIGTFDTFRVVCSLNTGTEPQGTLRTFYYAPAIDYYVRRVDRVGADQVQTITLTQYWTPEPRLPTGAERMRMSTRQSALETHRSGETTAWRDEASGISGFVQPVGTERSARHGWCRLYEESIEASQHRYHFERVACRTRNGAWQVVNS